MIAGCRQCAWRAAGGVLNSQPQAGPSSLLISRRGCAYSRRQLSSSASISNKELLRSRPSADGPDAPLPAPEAGITALLDAHERAKSAKSAKRSQDKDRGRVIFSGIQPTGIPHIGNYLGAMRQWVDLQDSATENDTLYFSIVGLHAITVPQDPSVLNAERIKMMSTLLAIGLDPQRVTLFNQDSIEAHAQLAWILNCITPFGKLQRMTTWKSKLATIRNAQSEEEIDESLLSLGLFAYPVLQAADILLYKATHVPVGEDQVQHLELARDIAQIFNKRFVKKGKSDIFPKPEAIITPSKRILSLRDPTQKMSKSSPDAASRILLTDTDDEIAKKFTRAVTDSEANLTYDPDNRPGVSNLLSILAAFKEPRPATADESEPAKTPAAWARELNSLAGKSGQTGRLLKEAVAEATIAAIRPIRQEIQRYQADPGHVRTVYKEGRAKASMRASHTMDAHVLRAVGLKEPYYKHKFDKTVIF